MVMGAPSPAEPPTPLRISLVRADDGERESWSAEVVGVPESSATGSTPEDAARRAWAAAESTLARSGGAGEPEPATRHSGRLLVRMPATLHDELARAAKGEGVSLNGFITAALASSIEWRRSSAAPAGADAGEQPTARSLRVALVLNLAVVVLAALVAVTLLVAWRAGW